MRLIDFPHGRIKRKAAVRELLLNRDMEKILAWCVQSRSAERVLGSLLYSDEPLIRWRAVEALGRLAESRAGESLDKVRETIRRMLWAVNDESGNNIRHAPEVIGEVLARVPVLIEEYAPLLCPLMYEPPFERGTHWAMARIAGIAPQVLASYSEELTDSLDDPDPYIRAFAILALAPAAAAGARVKIESLAGDETLIEVYDMDSGQLWRTTVGRTALLALGS